MRRRPALRLAWPLVAAVVLAGSGAGAREPSTDQCQPGAAAPGYGDRPPESGLHYGTRPVVLGCGQLASGRRIRLVGYQLGRRRTALCIDRIELATGQRSGCETNRAFGGGALDATTTSTGATGPALAGGATSASVRSVAMSYELDSRLRQAAALLIRISDPAVLRAIHVRRAFGQYLAEVPPRACAVFAIGGAIGDGVLGVASFERFGPPVGEGRRCQSLLRIVSLRFTGPHRRGAAGVLAVRLDYPNGAATTVEVAQTGRIEHADLVRSAQSRRTVRLPVRLANRRATVFDVTAKGVPLDRKRCGSAERRSAPRTLVVRAG